MSTFNFAVFSRKKITINTDPQRRCYDGCNFSEKVVWSEWSHIVNLPTREEADESAVLKFNKYGKSKIVYDTPITNDLIGWLSDDEVEGILSQIEAL